MEGEKLSLLLFYDVASVLNDFKHRAVLKAPELLKYSKSKYVCK